MNRQLVLNKWRILFIFTLAGLLWAFYQPAVAKPVTDETDGRSVPAFEEGVSYDRMLQQAWQNVQDAGSYRFISDISQTFIPRALPEMIGQQDTTLNLALDGAVVLPDQTYVEMRVVDSGRSESVTLLRDGGQSFMFKDGKLKPVEDVLNVASQSNDVLGYLSAAEQVILLEPPDGHPELTRYGFMVSGPRFAEYVRQQAEAELQREPGSPGGMKLEPLPSLQSLTGQGELWINEAGLPVRQVLELEMPQVNEQYSARIRMLVDLSGFGKVEALPQAIQGTNGKWHLEGELPGLPNQAPAIFPDLTASPAMTTGPKQTAQDETTGQPVHVKPTPAELSDLSDSFPIRIAPSTLVFFILAALLSVVIRFYRPYPRHVHAIIALILIPIMLFSPLLQSGGLARFQERQAEAAEESAAGVPELLGELGLESAKDTVNRTDTASPAENTASSTSLALTPITAQLQQMNEENEELPRCGQGVPGVDTDGDGLDDTVELCLGTDPDWADSDYDSISDGKEIEGFNLDNGTHWDSDPLSVDSNHDGLPDTSEWSSDLAENGVAVDADIDGDDIPNLWDDDDDGDGVPDGQDLSPFALTGYTDKLELSTTGQVAEGGIQLIELAIQPEELSHLRYSTTALDWPADELGNVKDLDDSTADLRLTPFLLVTTNVAPDATLAAKYGFSSWVDDQGQTTVMAPLQPLEENGAIYAFLAKVAYTADQTGDIQWQAKLVWMIQMQSDEWRMDQYSQFNIVTETRLLHQYEEPFRVTGLQVTRNEGAEVTLFGTPIHEDDRYLFQLFLGLNDTYLSYEKLEEQATNETALEALYRRFSDENTPALHRFDIPYGYVRMAEPVAYPNGDAAIAGVGSEMLPQFIDKNDLYKQRELATLLYANEQSQGVYDLRNFSRVGSDLRTADLSQLHVSLADVPVLTTRNVNLRMYEPDLNGDWQIITPARMLELINARYANDYATTLDTINPDLKAQHAQFIAVTGYLWAYAGSMSSVSVDGQALLPEVPDEDELALQRALENALDPSTNSINYLALATGIVDALGATINYVVGFDLNELPSKLGKLTSISGKLGTLAAAGLSFAASTASLVMGALNTACKVNPELKMCENEEAWLIANIVVKELALVSQMVSTAITAVKTALNTLEAMTKSSKITGVIGVVVGIAVAWITFAFTIWLTWGDPVAWRVALATAIVSTVWLIVMFALNFIPVIGQLIVAILSLIDAIISFFTWLFGAGDWNVAQAILKLFYDAKVTTSLKEAEFGEFESGLEDPDMGLIAGNVFKLEVPATGVIQKEKAGTNNDLNLSYVGGDLNPEHIANGFIVQRRSTLPDCHIVDDELHCSNIAALGYLLRPTINGGASFAARILYQTAWAEYGFYGTVRYKTHTTTGVLPEEEEGEETEPNTLYLDVLPATLSDLWNWPALGNPDQDGDGLTDEQEAALGTVADDWDSDGDGLSDYYEWQMAAEQGANPLDEDSDDDGLDDGLELRLGTRLNVADTDGDGLSDGAEVRRYDAEEGKMIGGWEVTLPNYPKVWISSDPDSVDDDGDGLNAYEEKNKGLSPYAMNPPVPSLSLRAGPVIDIPDARQGLYWLPTTDISFTISLVNMATDPVSTTLSLTLPDWLDSIDGGVLEGDRTISPVTTAYSMTWDFSGANALQLYEKVSTVVEAQVKEGTYSAYDEISLDLLYNDVQLHKPIQVTVDGNDPFVAIVAPADGAYLRGSSYVVGGAAIDPSTWVTEVSLSIVEQGNGANFQTLAGSKSPWAYTWEFPAGDHVYTLQAKAIDAMEHMTTTQQVNVTVDNTPPQVTLGSDMSGGTVHLSGKATDNLAGVQWVQLALDRQPWRSIPLNGEDWSYDWSFGEGAQGDHEVQVRAIDRSRNQSPIISDTIIVDSVAPSSIVNQGANMEVPPAVGANSAISLTGVADEGGHLPLPAVAADFRTGMDVFDDSTLWLGISSIYDNDGGVLATWIGDFNADRLADLAVGLPGPAGDTGQVSILYGRAGGWPTAPDMEMLAQSRTRFSGAAGARLGSYLAAAGDANGDNYADLLIGERNSNRAFLIFGNPGPLGGVTLEAGQTGYRTLLDAPAAVQGLASAGDTNGDGLDDILITAGGTAYLLLGRGNPWPETVDIEAEAADSWASVTGALGVGDVDGDQLAEWLILSSNLITLQGVDTETTFTADSSPHAVALGDVNGDGLADWLYASGESRILVNGSGSTTRSFSGYGGFFAAPGDVDGDDRPDILLATSAGTASVIRPGEYPEVFATIEGVGGAANAPYAAGADLNSDGSAELLLIPSQAAAEERGFDAPDFSSGFISPQSLPMGVSSPVLESEPALTGVGKTMLSMEGVWSFSRLGVMSLQTTDPDTFYVDDDSGGCDGNTPCYQTIQEAVSATDGGGDTIIVYPGVYGAFIVPSGTNYDYLTVKGVSADAVFVEGGTGDAIHVAADGVKLANLTVRDATRGVVLDAGAGEVPLGSGDETTIDQLLIHSVQNAVVSSQSSALTVSASTLVGDGTHPIFAVDSALNSAVHTWHNDQTLTEDPGRNAALTSTGGTLYALQGDRDNMVYTATLGAGGALGSWSSAFPLLHEMPSALGFDQSMLAAGGDYLYQMHPVISTPDFGSFNGEIHAVAEAPNGDVYVGGRFTYIGSTYALNVARWDGSTWHPLGSAIGNGVKHTDGSGIVYAITIVSNGDVYVGGHFNKAITDYSNGSDVSVPAHNIARWSGGTWLTLGEAVDGGNGLWGNAYSPVDIIPEEDVAVFALTHTDDDVVIAGGRFGQARTTSTTAQWVYDHVFYHPTRWTLGWKQYDGLVNAVGESGFRQTQAIRSLAWAGGNLEGPLGGILYAGGDFTRASSLPVNNVAYFQYKSSGTGIYWHPMGSGINAPVDDLAYDTTTGRVYAIKHTGDPVYNGNNSDHNDQVPSFYWWNPINSGWNEGRLEYDDDWGELGKAVAVDARGVVYVGTAGVESADGPIHGRVQALRPWANSTSFDLLNSYASDYNDRVRDLAIDQSGQVLVADHNAETGTGSIMRWTLEGLLQRDLNVNSWEWFQYPGAMTNHETPKSMVVDDYGRPYVADVFGNSSEYVARFNGTSWEYRANLAWESYVDNGYTKYYDPALSLVWAKGYLYGLAYSHNDGKWYLYRHNPAASNLPQSSWGDVAGWEQLGEAPLPAGTTSATNRSLTWDGVDSIYVLQTGGMYRYRISADAWDANLPLPSNFTISKTPGLVNAGSYLYAYAVPTTAATNVFRYGAVGASDLRLSVNDTALVMPDSASNLAYTNLPLAQGKYSFLTDFDNNNTWVGPSSGTWAPLLSSGAMTLTTAAADFMAPEDGLYRLGPDSQLTSGYHQYIEVAHVYPSQAACSLCGDTLTWDENAFATIREAVESGAARVLVHPGRYPQTFYLVSGVEVIGSGAETTIIEPPTGSGGILVSAEGAAGSSLARMTLAGRSGWQGFVAEGGATGLSLSRTIIRDLDTGVLLRDDSDVAVVNNTIVHNNNGFVAESDNPVNIRNTIFAYNSNTGLNYGTSPTSLSNTYNDFWTNGTDMNPVEVSLGSLFVDPRFRSLAADDFRLAEGSPLIDKGAPGDPTVPGGGERVDIGYAEYSAAGFYVSKEYSDTGLNDGLTWGIDAFAEIQPALDAAVAAMTDLQGALPEGGYSVGVDEGTYTETVTVPSHVRLVGSGPDVTTIDGDYAGSVVTFDAVIDSELSGFTVLNASANHAGVDLENASSGITIARNVIGTNISYGISLAGSSSAAVLFNTIVGNGDAGVYASGAGTWADVVNNILDGNGTGLQAVSGGLIRNDYNLLDNTADLDGVTAGDHTLFDAPAFASSGHYVPSAASPAIDAADPLAEVPLAGGLRADLGYKELIASPLTVIIGPEIDSTVTGNSGVNQVEVGVVLVNDPTQPVTATLPSENDWQTIPASGSPSLYYWSQEFVTTTTGLYRVYSRATDEAGNAEGEEADWYEGAFVVDSTAPTVNFTPALPGSTSDAAVLAVAEATGTVSTGNGSRNDLAQFYFSVVGPSGTAIYPAEDGQGWIPLSKTGTYTITAVAVDEAGNQAQQSQTLEVGASNHVATVSDPVNGSAVNSTDLTLHGYVRFTGTGAGKVEVGVSGGMTVTGELEEPGAAFSAWSANITLPAGDGTKTITITPTLSTAGEATTLNLTLDTIAPTLTVANPAAGTAVTRTVHFSGTVSDTGSDLARVEVSMDGGYTWRMATIDDGNWSLDWEMALFQDSVSYPARVRAVDAAGNSTVVQRTVVMDSIPPIIEPVTFDQPEGQHLDVGKNLTTTWDIQPDAGGTVTVLMAVDHYTETVPATEVSGTSISVTLEMAGDWYVHLIAQDAAGNQTLYHFGPWHVRDMANATFSERRQSIVIDGLIDLAHDEWRAGDLLGTDSQGLDTQQLYATWDGQAIFLGWSGAWWTLDGSMWAYLDVVAGAGSTQLVTGTQTLPFGADLAILIDGPESGSLYTWNGGWTLANAQLAFSHGSSGDTEARISHNLNASTAVQLLAFALPPETNEVGEPQAELLQAPLTTMAESKQGGKLLAAAETTALLATEGNAILPGSEEGGQPWAIFPTTNPPGQQPTIPYAWTTPVVGVMNTGQPQARTVFMGVSSPQAAGTAWGPGNTIAYEILLENPEPTAISGLTLSLAATSGLSYTDVTGAAMFSSMNGDANWILNVDPLAGGASTTVVVSGTLATDLSGLASVTSTIALAAGTMPLTAASNAVDTLTHRVDGQAPTVTIDALAGAVIADGEHTFNGTADDGDGAGVALVQVSANGGAWQTITGTLAWSAELSVPGSGAFTLQARAVDAYERESEIATQVFTVDSTAPVVSMTVPLTITSRSPRLSGTASDMPTDARVAKVEVQVVTDTSKTAAWQAVIGPFDPDTDGEQDWAWVWNAPVEDGAIYYIRARATDQVGNTTVTQWHETWVDNVAPEAAVTQELTSVNLPDNAPGPALNPATVLSATVTDGSGVQAVDVLVYDPFGGSFVEEARLVDGSWYYAPDLEGWDVGHYTLRLQAVDNNGNKGQPLGPYQLDVEDAPIEGLSAENDGPRMIDETVTFTATLTQGSNVEYTWAFGDGETADGRILSHAYTEAGDYTATVTATNSISSITATTSVTILALTLEAGEDQVADEGEVVEVVAAFTDSRDYVVHDATIDWGDGIKTDGNVHETNFTISGTHAFADNGWYTVTMTVTDNLGHAVTDTLHITVANVDPTAAFGNDGPMGEGTLVPVWFKDAYDPGSADTCTYSFDWDNDGYYDLVNEVDASAQHSWPDNGTYTVKGMVKDDDGGYHEYTTNVTVNNVAPSVNAGDDATINEGETFISSGSFTDPGTDTYTATVDYDDGGEVQDLMLGSNKSFALDHTYGDSGAYHVQVCVTDDDMGTGCDTTTVTVGNVAPLVTVDPESQTVQYSDFVSVTVTAIDVVADPLAITAITTTWYLQNGALVRNDILPNGLSVNPAPGTNCQAADENEMRHTCQWIVSGTIRVESGMYTVTVAIEDDDSGRTTVDFNLNVLPEDDTMVAFSEGNPTAVRVSEPGSDSPLFTLAISVTETLNDAPTNAAYPGDINLAYYDNFITLEGVGPSTFNGLPKSCAVNDVTPYDYGSVLSIECIFEGVPVNTYTVIARGNDRYYTAYSEDVLTVYDPSLGFTTGGGWFRWPGTGGDGCDGDSRTNFGYTMKYNKVGKRVQGSLLVICHEPDGTIYRLKSNALDGSGLALGDGGSFGWASFTGKATYLDPGMDGVPSGNYSFLVYVEDYDEPGSGPDKFWLETQDSSGLVVTDFSMTRPATVNTAPIGGGNIFAPHTGGPFANFQWESSNLFVTFNDQSWDSLGTITEWSWDFGDGQSSTQQSPAHAYGAGGSYHVTLTIKDNKGLSDSTTGQVNVYEGNQAPIAAFRFVVNRLSVDFVDLSTDLDGAIVYWSWDFGDGTTSTLQNPVHTFSADRTYDVVLTVTDDNGLTGFVSQPVAVVENLGPAAAFTYSANGLDVAFSDTSSDPDDAIATWYWEFGDGESSPIQNPTHTYEVAGTYAVSLTVTDAYGATDTTTQSVSVTDSNGSGEMDVAGLEGIALTNGIKKWKAEVTIQVLDEQGNPVADAVVVGVWSDGADGTSTCLTTAEGTCTVTKSGIYNTVGSVTFTVSNVTHALLSYNPSLYNNVVTVKVFSPSQTQGFADIYMFVLAMATTFIGGRTSFGHRRRRPFLN